MRAEVNHPTGGFGSQIGLKANAGGVAALFVDAIVLHDFATGTPHMLERFLHTDQLDVLQRELYRGRTKCISGHFADTISTLRNGSAGIAITVICARRGG